MFEKLFRNVALDYMSKRKQLFLEVTVLSALDLLKNIIKGDEPNPDDDATQRWIGKGAGGATMSCMITSCTCNKENGQDRGNCKCFLIMPTVGTLQTTPRQMSK